MQFRSGVGIVTPLKTLPGLCPRATAAPATGHRGRGRDSTFRHARPSEIGLVYLRPGVDSRGYRGGRQDSRGLDTEMCKSEFVASM